MRTTIDIPEDLLRRAKAAAALGGRPLKELVSEALQRLLSEAGRHEEARGPSSFGRQPLSQDCSFPLIAGEGGPALRDLRGGAAQRVLDEEDIQRVGDSG